MKMEKEYRTGIHLFEFLGKGEVNEKGLQFYDDLINELLKHKIEPILTIYHWDLPQALQDEYGGWESRQIVEDFKQYAITLFKRYGFVYVNQHKEGAHDLRRIKKKSFHWYKEVIESNGETL